MAPSNRQPPASPPFLDSDSATETRSRPVHQLNAQSLAFVENQYALYVHDPNSVSPDWREYFDEIHADHDTITPEILQAPFPQESIFHRSERTAAALPVASDEAVLQEKLDQLIRNYRVRGHIISQIDPLQAERPSPPELDPAYYGLTEEHLNREFSTQMFGGPEKRTLKDILAWLQSTYCRSIGVQFMHIDSLQVRAWLQDRMESGANRIRLSREQQIRILTRLCDASSFEEFIQKKYLGAKSFSLEGAESLIPLLDMAIERANDHGVDLIVMGMAHRGRLNVLANIMGKRPSRIFREFEDRDPERLMGRGDVKYHLGYSSDWTTQTGNKVHLTLCFNPSHLEFVNPVALGRLRAKQDHLQDYSHSKSCAILIHGDAAFAGEGIVQETLNMSELPGYKTGGTVHIIVNNQIGFTTSPSEGRSCTYATDVARMLQIPIFHVNGEDPEAVAQVVRLAMDFREHFHRDVIIDMYCYRRRGHNEGDEPAFTQPTMYRAIQTRKSVFESYRKSLLSLNELGRGEIQGIMEARALLLEEELAEARRDQFQYLQDSGGGIWEGFFGGPYADSDKVNTGLTAPDIQRLTERLNTPPEGFTPHKRVNRILQQRLAMGTGNVPFDWGGAELLAFGSLVDTRIQMRFSGQDVRRGTFSHRHAALYDADNGKVWIGLQDLADRPELVEIHNSPLSEAGVVGYEYGYSLDCPNGLVIWEAQFGDFVNAAQVIIDQFISSAEDKWDRLSGLVMLLPHGFEGQGPEHSSARLERFLMLAAEDNMTIAVPSTPSQYFHMLRRHVLRKWTKPLIVMTPKSLLRHKEAVSPLSEFQDGHFGEVIPDTRDLSKNKVRRILLCCGKVYYELEAMRRELACDDIAIIRIEQLYPFPTADLESVLSDYPAGIPAVWVQEEPTNNGAWPFLRVQFGENIFNKHPFEDNCRPASASPATGSGTSHKIEQQALLQQAFAIS